MANHQGGWAYARAIALAMCATSALAACGARESAGGDQLTDHRAETRTSALDTRDSARAAYFAAEAAKYRDIADHDRQLSAAYARLTLPASATKNWNAILKARVEARAAAADQIAAGVQAEADFHAAKAGAQ